jgi:hypothetical protein
MIEIIPFNEELNRLILKVSNPSASKLEVTWGPTSRTYAAAELKEGINLAADFLENPFSEPFAKAEATLKKKQQSENTVITMLESIRDWREILPGYEDTYDAMQKGVIQKCLDEIKAASKVAVPVEHTIRISPAS